MEEHAYSAQVVFKKVSYVEFAPGESPIVWLWLFYLAVRGVPRNEFPIGKMVAGRIKERRNL